MLNWEHFRYFLEVHRQGSLKTAAKKLGVNQTTVGRTLTTLEDVSGTRLFERKSDGFILTAAGSRILDTMHLIETNMLNIERLLAGEDERPEGKVKIAMPGAIANHWFIPLIEPLLIQYPHLVMEFLTGPEVLNLTRREADIALRLVRPKQKELVSKRMGTLNLVLAGHKKLFRHQSKPKKIDDLVNFPFIGLYEYATSKAEQSFLDSCKSFLMVTMRSAAWSSVYSAVSGGIGIGILPSFMVKKEQKLEQILPELKVSMPMWLVYHPDLRHCMRVRVVIDYLQANLREEL